MAAGDTPITFVGNIGKDPELRFTPTGVAVCQFSVGSTPRWLDKQTNEWKDGETTWLRCVVWREAAEYAAESLERGMRVIVVGRLVQRSYDTKEGEKRTSYEIQVDDVGPSLRRATAKVVKADRAKGNGGGSNIPADPWANGGFQAPSGAPGGGFGGDLSDEPPF